jgi:uncharacterized protein (DUF58 family)
LNKNLKKILIKTKKSIFSNKIGNNTSKFKGEGYDFVELREYEAGEDVRKIDWIISAKIGKPYIKLFHAQRELDINIVPILGGSVSFGTDISKQEVITQIVSLIGYSCVSQGDNYSGFIVNDMVDMVTKKTKNIHAVDGLAQKIYEYDPIGKSVDYQKMAHELFKKIRRKSIIFLIGDFLGIDSFNLKLLAKKHEVIAVIVRDRFEEYPKALGNVNLIDPENMDKFDGVITQKAVEEYSKKIKQSDQKLFKNFKEWGVEYTKIYTEDNIIAKMMKVFQ